VQVTTIDQTALTDALAAWYESIRDAAPTEDLSGIWRLNIREFLARCVASRRPFVDLLSEVHKTNLYSLQFQTSTIDPHIDWYLMAMEAAGVHLLQQPPHFHESAAMADTFCRQRLARRVSPEFLNKLWCLETLRRHLRFDRRRLLIVELGAGYGGLARLLKLAYPDSTIVVIDIPETLFFSAGYLISSFPDAKATLADGRRPVDFDADDFVFLPVGAEGAIGRRPIDLFVNCHSLGEMPNHVIDRWFDFIQTKADVRHAFMLNRFLNPTMQDARLGENRSSVSFDRRWDILAWEFEPGFERCPFETEANPSLMVVARRGADTRAADERRKALSEALLANVCAQDWYRTASDNLLDIVPPPTAYGFGSLSRRGHIVDTGRGGTLFMLWEAVRLDPTPENIRVMGRYLGFINMLGPPFEELYYYLERLQKLTGKV
jgi:putative sugar O-methyltransferase